MAEVVKDKVAFAGDENGIHFEVWYLKEPKGEALVEFSKDGVAVRSFLWPSYKVWNIAAHAKEITEDMERGLAIAGSDGLGGGVVRLRAALKREGPQKGDENAG